MSLLIAYLAPEIPALSATFVYEEFLALEKRGCRVLPLTVHRPQLAAKGHPLLESRCSIIYEKNKWRVAKEGLSRLFFMPGIKQAFAWLAHDVWELGFNKEALKLLFQFLAAGKVAYILRHNRVDHLHIHFAHVPAQVGMYAAALAEVPFTVMAHANDIFERGVLLKEKAERARRLVTISKYNLNYLLSLGLPKDKLAVVRCGVSFSPPKVWPSAKNQPIQRVGTLGRLVEKKGIDVLIDALSSLQGIYLSIAGDGPLLNDLKAKVVELGMQKNVEFVGVLGHEQVATWMAELDMFVLACKQDSNGDMDGIPVVLMEAMSQGVPVVATRISGIPELVVDGVTGLLAKPADPADLKEKILKLTRSTQLRDQLALAAAKHVENEFSQTLNISRLEAIFGLQSEERAGD